MHIRQLLITCAELIAHSDFSAAHRMVSILFANSSPYGDSTERLAHQFARALFLRLNPNPSSTTTTTTTTGTSTSTTTATAASSDASAIQSCYLTLNQITPFIRFTHLTANQAILEAIDEDQQAIHILDFDIMHGVQWPPFMQALAERSFNTLRPPPMLRITATGTDLDLLNRTGDRLLRFAQSLGLRFQFHPLLLLPDNVNTLPSGLSLLPDEALAVNCMMYLHRLLEGQDGYDYDCGGHHHHHHHHHHHRYGVLRGFLQKIKALNPKIVTIAEREAEHNSPVFLQRFVDALDYYAAIFDCLEANLPPNSRERLSVEQVWFGKEIVDVIAEDGDGRQRSERYETWESLLRGCGFSNVPLSPFALSQAKLLLRLHYPSEGYQLRILNDSFFLGWQSRPLFSVSSWH